MHSTAHCWAEGSRAVEARKGASAMRKAAYDRWQFNLKVQIRVMRQVMEQLSIVGKQITLDSGTYQFEHDGMLTPVEVRKPRRWWSFR